jgi:hypothetical protein
MILIFERKRQVAFLVFMQIYLLLREYFLMVQLFLVIDVTLILDLSPSDLHSISDSLPQQLLPGGELKRETGCRDHT